MKKIIANSFAFGLLVLLGCSDLPQNEVSTNEISFALKSMDSLAVESSIRAIEFDQRTKRFWWAGSAGKFGLIELDLDGNSLKTPICKVINEGKIEYFSDDGDTLNLEFRSLAITVDKILVMSVGSPALIFSSADNGNSWDLVYENDHPDVFFDSMKFWDDQNGIAVGDPIDGCPAILITRDGGENWKMVDCSSIPDAEKGEAFFAASNTNIAIFGDNAWIASGGSKARVFRTQDLGETWEVFNTPIAQGKLMTGTFSIDFYDANTGIIAGGDWEDKSIKTETCAITRDGGETWEPINHQVEFASCVQFVPGLGGNGVLASGSNGIFVSKNGGEHWEKLLDSGQYAFRFNRGSDDDQYYFIASGRNIIQPYVLSVIRHGN